jgi:DNA polymerase-3 subunit epsilon
MNARKRFLLAVLVLGLLMTGPFLVTVVVIGADMNPAERAETMTLLLRRLPIGTLMTIIGFVAGVQVLRLLFRQYVQGLLRMGENLRLMLGANRNFRVGVEGPPEVRELARAANDLAQQRDELLTDVEAQISRAKASVEEEKNRLAALMSDLALAVVVCNLDGRILLYNQQARLQFSALAQGSAEASGGALIGLGRSIFSILERGQIAHALDGIRRRQGKGGGATANFITTARTGQLLRMQMVPVLGAAVAGEAPSVTGFVLTSENITRAFERESQRDQAFHSLTDGSRSALGNIRAAVETLKDDPAMAAAMRERFVGVIDDEATRMSVRLEAVMNEFADSLKTRWPLEEVLGSDLIAAARRRVEDRLGLPTKTEDMDGSLWVRVDSFSLIQAIAFIASRLQDDYDIRELRFRLSGEGRMAFVDLIWSGTTISSETLYTWELEPMRVAGEVSPMTLRDVVERHGGEFWYQREKAAHRAFIRIVLPAATPEVQAVPQPQSPRGESRPEYYDFDLFTARDSSIDPDRRLAELAYTVFDTETTGLDPAAGDEIIQIGAVRLLNGRLLPQEVFDQLLDPRLPLKPESVAIHGITEDMLRGRPTADVVVPAFHEFCQETVLVAHNAAFDLRFLQLKEAATGVRFTQPVLDTLLLSAAVQPNQEAHGLEAIAERLGVNIIGRHTALGDAFVTAEVFLKLVPLLANMGIVTLRQALAASQETYYARIKY